MLLYVYLNIHLIHLINFFIMLCLCCFMRVFSSCSEWAFHCGGFSCCWAKALVIWASEVVVWGLSCSVAYGIFPDQELKLCPLHWWGTPIHCTTREVPFKYFWHLVLLSLLGSRLWHQKATRSFALAHLK